MTPEHNEINYKCKVHGKVPFNEIYKVGKQNGKQRYICKVCTKVRDSERYQKCKEKFNKTRGDWRKNNKELAKEASRRAYNKQKNIISYKEMKRDYVAKLVAELN